MKLLFTLSFSVVCVFSFCQKEETVRFSSMDEMIAYGKFTDSLRENFVAEDHIDSVFILLNEYRVEQGVEPVVLDTTLCKIALIQAKYCAENLIVTHHHNIDSLKTMSNRASLFNEQGNVSGEVATSSSFSSSLLVNRTIPKLPIGTLIKSPGHAWIMERKEHTRCGVAMVQSEVDRDKYYTVIVFANR